MLFWLVLCGGNQALSLRDKDSIAKHSCPSPVLSAPAPLFSLLPLSYYLLICFGASLVAQVVKNLPAMHKTQVRSLGGEDPLEKGMATHSSILAGDIPWTEEPGGLLTVGSQKVRHD